MSRIRANQITNQSADGAPTVQNGLVISGVTTSTTFSGSGASLTNIPSAQLTGALPALDGSNLTGLSGVSVANQSDNRIITATGTTDALNSEANLTFDGSSLDIFNGSNSSTIKLKRHASTASEQAHIGYFSSGLHIETRESTYITLKTNTQERLRIDSNGDVKIKSFGNASNASADALQIGKTDNNYGITILSATNAQGRIDFTDTEDTNDPQGKIAYYHDTNSLQFFTNGGAASNERLRINSSGQLLLGTTTPGAAQVDTFTLETSGHTGMTLFSGTSSRGTIAFGDGRSGNAQYRGVILYEHSNDSMRFATADTTQMNISSTGQITKPYQASFAAMAAQNSYSLNGQVFPFNTTTHNIGSHFNTSNYRFTAPVAGRYLFTFYSILNSSGQGRYEILINGAADQNGTRVHMTPNTTNWDHVSTSWILNLAANDYIQMYSQSNTGWHGNHWQRFCGELLS